jgi:hypothetical protein
MGKFIKTLVLFLFAVVSYSQTTIGELKFGGVLSVGLYQHETYFNLIYQDDQFTHIREYKSFNLLEDEKETLYELLIANKEPNTSEQLFLKSGDVIHVFYKKNLVSFIHVSKYGTKGYCRLNLKQVKKIWGKGNT